MSNFQMTAKTAALFTHLILHKNFAPIGTELALDKLKRILEADDSENDKIAKMMSLLECYANDKDTLPSISNRLAGIVEPTKETGSTRENVIIFNLNGTLVNHETSKVIKAIPFMPDLLNGFNNINYDVCVLSKFPEIESINILKMANIKFPGTILSSHKADAGTIIARYLQNGVPCNHCTFIDDNPKNLESVLNIFGKTIRLIGFIGSRKHARELSSWCKEKQVELALSPYDLHCALGDHLPSDFSQYLNDDLIWLIPGLNNLSSSPDRCILRDLLTINAEKIDYKKLWKNIGWIRNRGDLWSTLARTVVQSCGIEENAVFVNSYTPDSYTANLKEFAKKNPSMPLRSSFEKALDYMLEGINEIGQDAEAEDCRIGSSSAFDKDRIKYVQKCIREVFDV